MTFRGLRQFALAIVLSGKDDRLLRCRMCADARKLKEDALELGLSAAIPRKSAQTDSQLICPR